MATNVIKTPLVIGTHVRKFNSTSRLKDKNKGAAIGAVNGKLYWHNGTGPVQILDASGLNLQGQPNTTVSTLTGSVWATGTAGVANVLAWQNPSTSPVIITRVLVYVAKGSNAPSTLVAGTSTVSPTQMNNDLIYADNLQVLGVYSNLRQTATEQMEVVLPGSGWVTFTALGDPTGFVGNAYINYFLV